MNNSAETKIAVMQTQIEELRAQHREHKEEITKTLNDLANKVFSSINDIRDDIKDIYEFISRGTAAALLMCASALGGVVVAVVSWALTRFLK